VSKLEDYREVAPRGTVDLLLSLAERVQGRRFLHVGATRYGGGPAEILRCLVPILRDLGIDARWEIVGGDTAFFATARGLATALQGDERVITDEMLAHYLEMNRISADRLGLAADLVLVHDAAPVSLVAHRPAEGRWVWRCHLDLSTPDRRVWNFVRPFAGRYDAVVFSLPGFAQRLPIPRFIIHPSIDPLSEKNRDLSRREIRAVVEALGVGLDKPFLLQVGLFDRQRDPVGAVNAYRTVKKHHDVRLVLAGGGSGDGPAGGETLAQLRDAAARDPDVVVLELPADAHLQINALQRAAAIVLQRPVRDGFALEVAEAMWKGKPVIGGTGGGVAAQILHDVTGYTVRSVEGAAFRIRQLLTNPELIARMGGAGREHVRRNFLVTRHLSDYLALLAHVTGITP
jgi:trehalose synthase